MNAVFAGFDFIQRCSKPASRQNGVDGLNIIGARLRGCAGGCEGFCQDFPLTVAMGEVRVLCVPQTCVSREFFVFAIHLITFKTGGIRTRPTTKVVKVEAFAPFRAQKSFQGFRTYRMNSKNAYIMFFIVCVPTPR